MTTLITRSAMFDTTALLGQPLPVGYPALPYRETDRGFYSLLERHDTARTWFDSPIGCAMRVYNEAVVENDHRLALVPRIELPEVNPLQAEIEVLRRQVRELQAPIVEGDDDRLTEFWERAAEQADREGFCPEYDRIARAMGGTARQHTYYVDVVVETSVQVEVEASSNEDARDQVASMDVSEIVDYGGGFNNAEMRITGSYRE